MTVATCALLACTTLLGVAGVTLERALCAVLLREELGDIRFRAYPYVGRLCDDLHVESRASTGTVTIENTGSSALAQLQITIKAFAHSGNVTLERKIARIEPGEVITYEEEDLELDTATRTDLGMLYVRVRCDKGYAVARGWWSYWG